MNPFLSILILTLGIITNSLEDSYPVPPKTNKMLFYIQRNHNKNTIVYDANFDNYGQLTDENPIDVYWIRYEEDGRRMELRKIEQLFAYGVNCLKSDSIMGAYQVHLVADPSHTFLLMQTEPFKAIITTTIDHTPAQLKHMYIQADNSGWWPKVEYIELFGNQTDTREPVYEKISNQ